MAKLNEQQVTEVNELIERIQKSVKSKCEIGSQNKVVLRSILTANSSKQKVKFFDCKREYADTVVNYFVQEKGLTKSRFSVNGKEAIFLLI